MSKRRNYQTRAFLLAQHEADLARVADLTTQLSVRNAEIRALRAQIDDMATQQLDRVKVETQRERMARAKQLAKDGVPCFVRGEHIYHAITKAIIP